MKKFGSGISYLTIDLIRIWKSSNKDNFAENRGRYYGDSPYYGRSTSDRKE